MKIGIIGAMKIEIDNLIEDLKEKEVATFAGRNYFSGIINNISVVIVESGIGMVNAAIATQIMIDKFAPDYIINTGIAGSLDTNVHIKDVVVATDAVQHLFDVSKYGYPLGQIPNKNVFSFESDKYLLEIISGLSLENISIHHGRIVSGDKFISDDIHKTFLKNTFNALCAEMEGASIAHVCFDNNIPFIIIRSISDNADDNASISYDEFEKIAADTSKTLTLKLIDSLSSSKR